MAIDPSVIAAAVGAGIGAAIPAVYGPWKTRHDARVQRNEDLRRRRMEVYMAFCGAALDYRRAVLNQWYVRARLGGKDAAAQAEPAVGEDVRATRAAAWSRYYEVFMLSSGPVSAAADAALQSAAAISGATPARRKELSDQVHREIKSFAELAATSVRTR
ncbi:hypothetical protein [Blastococcus xanthinilyticus]|uniref:Uncharacterized protein n=1 Tax=Blastococcus xanthinilyticus TaxID=1564164 RepID=A0A5S5CUW8_9ACTN|nr:hypothetical protein [Blastococcus xanthinilyticus]TYP87513.1 hypothetical protein BD833_106101 [Blastococcus xanthinilyticus]